MARRNVRLLRHKTEESSGKLILISHGDRDGGSQCALGCGQFLDLMSKDVRRKK